MNWIVPVLVLPAIWSIATGCSDSEPVPAEPVEVVEEVMEETVEVIEEAEASEPETKEEDNAPETEE